MAPHEKELRDLFVTVARIDERTEQIERHMVSKSDLSAAIDLHMQREHRSSWQAKRRTNGEVAKAKAKLLLALAGAITLLAAAIAAYLGYIAS